MSQRQGGERAGEETRRHGEERAGNLRKGDQREIERKQGWMGDTRRQNKKGKRARVGRRIKNKVD